MRREPGVVDTREYSVSGTRARAVTISDAVTSACGRPVRRGAAGCRR